MLNYNVNLICYIPEPNAPWKIFLPTEILDPAVRWYHLALSHIGQNRLYDTMSQHLYHPDLRRKTEDVVTHCDACQKQKQVGRGYGYTAPREAAAHPWRDVAVDLVGPWPLTIGGYEHKFMALTIIDMVTNLVELVRLENKTSAHVALQFENTWLSRYPKPLHCIHDQGGEFTGYAFQRLLQRMNIHSHPISVKNPQANSICERMHQTVGNSLRAMEAMNPPQGVESAIQMVDTALANCLFALRSSFHSGLGSSPGSLAFNRDMILDIPLVADWLLIQQKRQALIDQRLIEANRKRFSHDYHIGDEVLKLVYNPTKLEPRAVGPYRIETVHANGTVTIRLDANTIERLSLRRIKPYRR